MNSLHKVQEINAYWGEHVSPTKLQHQLILKNLYVTKI